MRTNICGIVLSTVFFEHVNNDNTPAPVLYCCRGWETTFHVGVIPLSLLGLKYAFRCYYEIAILLSSRRGNKAAFRPRFLYLIKRLR